MRKLKTTVHFTPEGGEAQVVPAGTPEDELPEGVEITNPAAWEEDSDDEEDFDDGQFFVEGGTGNNVVDLNEEGEDFSEDNPDEYSRMTVTELRRVADARDVDVSGLTKKAELQTALRDAANS